MHDFCGEAMDIKETTYKSNAGLCLTIALVSDFHNSDPAPVTGSLRRRKPDIIAVTGDLLVGHSPGKDELITVSQKNVLPFIRSCTEIAPTFLSLGNHEWMVCEEDIGLLESAGAVVLDNGFVASRGAVIGGLTSAVTMNYRRLREREGGRYPDRPQHLDLEALMPDFEWLDDFERQDGYRILLCHHPEYWSLREPVLRERNISLVLSGHAHGGQIRLFGQGLYAPGQGWFPRYTGGVHRGAHGEMIVSRGLSNTVALVPRLFNPTEIVYVELSS